MVMPPYEVREEIFFENLTTAVFERAAKDLRDRRVNDLNYSSAVYFFTHGHLFLDVALMWLDVSYSLVERCRGLINGRVVVPIQALLL